MEELCRLGDKAERQKGEPKMGVKKKPWWSHYMILLLYCDIGIGNQMLYMLRDIINKHLENMTCTKERTSIDTCTAGYHFRNCGKEGLMGCFQ